MNLSFLGWNEIRCIFEKIKISESHQISISFLKKDTASWKVQKFTIY